VWIIWVVIGVGYNIWIWTGEMEEYLHLKDIVVHSYLKTNDAHGTTFSKGQKGDGSK